ncbi:MAG: hypothetical protein K0Q53_980 [Massilibacillus sp.]|jgi:hypothetical protein|nr:hypothetical protein [Massilibacillus sp.]
MTERLCFNSSKLFARDHFRLLWEQHVYWTRLTIISLIGNLPNLKQTTDRLLRNASDFTQLFKRYYKDRDAMEFGYLIKEHLLIAAELISAAKSNDQSLAENAEARWYHNADEIVCFLNHINPNWTKQSMQSMWYKHLALTKEEAVAHLKKEYRKDILIFDQIEKEALLMADSFSNGIIKQLDL